MRPKEVRRGYVIRTFFDLMVYRSSSPEEVISSEAGMGARYSIKEGSRLFSGYYEDDRVGRIWQVSALADPFCGGTWLAF